MEQSFDANLTEFLCSRLCHELVGPVGAANNGIELIKELGDNQGEAFTLLADSVELAAKRLLFYRMAYGAAGYNGLQNPEVVRDFIASICPKDKVTFTWQVSSAANELFSVHEGIGKLLLNLVVIVIDCLPRGGSFKTIVDTTGASIEATGTGARISEYVQTALQGDFDTIPIEAATAHTIFTLRLAQRLNIGLEVTLSAKDNVKFILRAN